MLYDLRALRRELPCLAELRQTDLCELLASLGFPVDGVTPRGEGAVLDLDVTANRGDAQSHRGLARDLAARLGASLAPMDQEPLPEGEPLFPVRLEAEACPLYATALLELGAAQATPEEAADLLAALGMNAKQLAAVDASNELLHRTGQPTHAFDAERLQGALVVRWGRPGETLLTLDGVERRLSAEDLVIADEAGPVALAGLMGGEGTKVHAGTRRVLLESAWFDPRVVRRMAHRHGLHTDASQRFGRGADPAMARVVRDLFVARLQAWAGARLLGAWTAGALPPARPSVHLGSELLARIAGEAIPMTEAAALLGRLGCAVAVCAEGGLDLRPPTWRHDLAIPEDFAEEVLRLRGFDRIGAALPPLEGPPVALDPGYLLRRRLASRLAHLGFFQTVTYGFVDPWEDKGFALGDAPEGRTLANPLGQEYSLLRGTLLRSLRDVALGNLAQGAREVRLFEIAPTFRSGVDGPEQHWTLALLWAGQQGGQDPLSPVRPLDTEQGRAFLLGVLRDLGVDAIQAERLASTGKLREVLPEEGGKTCGWMAELAVETLPVPEARVIPGFVPFSRFPVVERDLSLLVGLDQGYRALVEAMAGALRNAAGAIFQGLGCVDVFRHRSLPAGRQAWLMRARFQAMDRTLTGEEVEAWMAAALAAARSLGAELRG